MSRIRLIRQDNQVIEIDATAYTLSVSRSVPVLPIPVLAERLAIDINAVQSDIQIDCILRDDDCSATKFQQDAAFCTIDFGLSAETSGGDNDIYMVADGGAYDIAALHNKSFELATSYTNKSRARASITIKFDNTTSSHVYATGSPLLTIGIGSLAHSGAALAARIVAAFAVDSSFGVQLTTVGSTSDTILDALTISAGAGSISATGNSKLTITSVEKGPDGNNATPVFWTDSVFLAKPKFELFGGGTLHNCKSAGDKLQDLIGVVGNANLAGVSGRILDVGLDIDEGNGLDTSFSVADRSGDYIVGIQIPYNSLVQKVATDASNDGYVTRNLLMVTGVRSIEEQSSIGNNNPFGTDFNVSSKFTGIRGTIVGMNFGYDAGNNIYEGSLTFQPADMIVGL
tara:strand:- start:823 stop:2022 length:1200 start_codon:yes stop_codon:yes gene_type:complete